MRHAYYCMLRDYDRALKMRSFALSTVTRPILR